MKRFNLMPKEVSYADGPSTSMSYRSKDTSIIIVSLPIIIAFAVIYFRYTSGGTKVKEPEGQSCAGGKTSDAAERISDLNYGYPKECAIFQSSDRREEQTKEQSRCDTLVESGKVCSSRPPDRHREEHLRQGSPDHDKQKGQHGLAGRYLHGDNKSLSEFMDILINQNVFKNVNVKSTEYSDEFGPYKQKFIIVGVL